MGEYSPIGTPDSPVKLWLAGLAVVLIRQLVFIRETHAAAVLPDMTLIALNEEITQVVSGRI